MKIYLIRHGRTALNRKGVYCGWKDPPLDERGREQAARLARSFEEKTDKPELIYSSDLRRAKGTAEKLREVCQAELRVSEKLRELSFGDWEGKTYREISEERPSLYERAQENPSVFRPPGGETPEELKRRVLEIWERILAAEEDVAVVSHAGPLKIILLECLEASLSGFWRLRLATGSLSEVLVWGERPLVRRVNCEKGGEEKRCD